MAPTWGLQGELAEERDLRYPDGQAAMEHEASSGTSDRPGTARQPWALDSSFSTAFKPPK